jgi:hypothetical protein
VPPPELPGIELRELVRSTGRNESRNRLASEMKEGPLLNFSDRTVQRFIAIAQNETLSDATRVSLLPPSWETLYELSRLDAARLDRSWTSARADRSLERRICRGLAQVPLYCIATRPHISFVSGRRAGSGEMSICGIGYADLPVIALTDIDRCMVALPSAETMAEF